MHDVHARLEFAAQADKKSDGFVFGRPGTRSEPCGVPACGLRRAFGQMRGGIFNWSRQFGVREQGRTQRG